MEILKRGICRVCGKPVHLKRNAVGWTPVWNHGTNAILNPLGPEYAEAVGKSCWGAPDPIEDMLVALLEDSSIFTETPDDASFD